MEKEVQKRKRQKCFEEDTEDGEEGERVRVKMKRMEMRKKEDGG